MNITDKQADYVANLVSELKNKGFRATADLRNEKIGFKIREHTLKRVPYLLVVGDQEIEQQQVAVRTRRGEDLGKLAVSEFFDRLQAEVTARTIS